MTMTQNTTPFSHWAQPIFDRKLESLKKREGSHFDRLRKGIRDAQRAMSTSPESMAAVLLCKFEPCAVDVLAEVAEEQVGKARLDLLNVQAAEKSGKPCLHYKFRNDWPAYRADCTARLQAALDRAGPMREEYNERGWRRYFLVANSGGHIHHSMHCDTCFETTRFSWLADMSDCDENEMVETYGERACTVCFPDAPTMKGWGKVAEEEAAKWCPGSGQQPTGTRRLTRYHYETCPECGLRVPITKGGKYRKHARPK